MRRTKSGILIIAVALVVAGLLSTPADAQLFKRVTGIAVTQTGMSGPGGLTAEFDITLNTVSPRGVFSPAVTPYGRPAPPYLGFLGNFYTVQTYGGFGTPVRAELTLVTPVVNAIEFGTTTVASTPLANTTIPAVTPGTPGQYRGSFMHTYPAPGNYDMRVGAAFNFNVTNATGAPQTVNTGNAVTIGAGAPLIWTSIFKFYGATTTNTIPFTYNTVAPSARTIGVTNAASGGISVGAGPPVPIIEVPTVSEYGLIALALALAAAGWILLKR